MTTSRLTELQTITVTDSADLVTFWGALLGAGRFARRTLWLAVLDEDGRPVPVAMPIDDIPVAPSGRHLDGLTTVVNGIADYGTVIALVARPGSSTVGENDRRWALALAPLAPRWPIHLATAHDGHCRVQPILVTS
jgi:hypothetical protein